MSDKHEHTTGDGSDEVGPLRRSGDYPDEDERADTVEGALSPGTTADASPTSLGERPAGSDD